MLLRAQDNIELKRMAYNWKAHYHEILQYRENRKSLKASREEKKSDHIKKKKIRMALNCK